MSSAIYSKDDSERQDLVKQTPLENKESLLGSLVGLLLEPRGIFLETLDDYRLPISTSCVSDAISASCVPVSALHSPKSVTRSPP